MAVAAEFSEFQRSILATAWQTLVESNGMPLPLPPVQLFSELPSTNQKLWELLRQGDPMGTAVLARQQAAGRGQWGRQWVSEPGGIYLSLAIAPQLAATAAAQLTLAGAWGIANQFQRLDVPVWLKWPNDLVLEGRKLGGILTETRIQQGHITQAVVGVGINWQNFAPAPGIRLVDWLPETSSIKSLEMVVAIALYGLLSGFHYWQTAGVAALVTAYDRLLLHRGVGIAIAGKPGWIVGVTPAGQLRIQWRDGPQLSETESAALLEPGSVQLGYDQLGDLDLTQR